MRRARWVALALIMAAIVISVFRFLTGQPSMDVVLRVVVQILVFWPIKGALIRFLGGARPYRSALAANSSSELIGLGFPLAATWPGLLASFFLSSAFEGLALTAVGTAEPKTSFSVALYANFFVHVLLAGIKLWAPQPLLGGIVIFLSFMVFILPIFIVSRPIPTSQSRKLSSM